MSEERTRTTNGSTAGGIKESVLKVLLGGTGGGAGVAIVYFAYDLLRQSPEKFAELLAAWGPGFLYVAAFLWIGHGYVKKQGEYHLQQLAVSRESAAASARLAGAVESLALRDDQRAREQEIVLNHLATQTHDILAKLEAIDSRLPQ